MVGLPSPIAIRKRIESVSVQPIRMALMCAYLWCARSCEVVADAYPSDDTTPYGPRGTDVRLVEYRSPDGLKEVAAVFTVRTAKRKGRERFIALPTNPEYEPWTLEIVKYFEQKGESEVFPFTRQHIHKVISAEETFKHLRYPIEPYKVVTDKGLKTVELHERDFKLHALRHLRATELVDFYGFTLEELATYGGWSFKTASIGSSSMARYLALSWQGYFPKLLKTLKPKITATA
ncbi:MAG: hypothetical protein ABC596_09165 [Candidatus Methanosuratincola petrocarbonis]